MEKSAYFREYSTVVVAQAYTVHVCSSVVLCTVYIVRTNFHLSKILLIPIKYAQAKKNLHTCNSVQEVSIIL